MKVYGVLVTYNPDYNELEEAVERLLEQVDKLVIANNSKYDVFFNHERIYIFNFGENLGIAKAQSIAMKWAFIDEKAEFIVQMDQDSIIPVDMVKQLLNKYQKLSSLNMRVGIIGPKHYDKTTNQVDKSRLIKGDNIENENCTIVKATISSGSLIPREAYLTIGGMDDGLFIDFVDWEYSWRLKQHGWLTIRANGILLGHQVGDGKQKILGKIDARIPAPIRHYYHTRNIFLLLPRDYAPLKWKIKELYKLFFKLIIYPFVFSDGFFRCKYILRGIKDGVLQRYGRIDQLYRR
ncbi:glycosyltransferase family 2 protein [Tenacibaculum sp. SSH1-16]|uniref:glycosyltransferase family 2 protein n=1 Tax=Tenacibaculum sp. SSH1-16 TaxID=3136667 RepID=UPI0032C4A312|nr:rhamnosyltransferase [Tenacibaculum mesophilum]